MSQPMEGVAEYTSKVEIFRKLVNLRNCAVFKFQVLCFRVINKTIF